MNIHRYTLEPYGSNSKKTCPKCKKSRSFTLYIDIETNEHVNPKVGICDHKLNCGYHLPPKQYFQENNISIDTSHCVQLKRELIQQKPASYIRTEIMEASLRGYNQNNLVKFLRGYFSEELIAVTLKKYFVGTSKHWIGSAVFWLVDTEGKIRSGKICQYNPETGKRIKEPYPLITWVHRVLRLAEFQLKKCLFGEHLLEDVTKTIALVESEKTALICSMCLPEHIWLATGGLTNLTSERCSVLKGRTVILFPDLKGYELWSEKAKELSKMLPGTCFKVSDELERKASDEDREDGLDIADYLIKHRKPIAEAENALELLVEKNPILSNLIKAFKLVQVVPEADNKPS